MLFSICSEGYRKSHSGIKYDKTAENSAASQGNQAQKIDQKELDGNDKNKPSTEASVEPSEGSDPSGQVIEESSTEEQKVPDSIYRAYGDTWKCHNCNARGDRWFMIKHYCRGQLKPKSGGSK